MKKTQFSKIARLRGIVGAPFSGADAVEKSLALLDEPGITVEFDGPVGDVCLRAYWNDDQGNGGCMAIPNK